MSIKREDYQSDAYLIIIFLVPLFVFRILWAGFSSIIFEVDLERAGERDGCKDTHNGGESQHKSNHDPSKIHSTDGVQQNWEKYIQRNTVTETSRSKLYLNMFDYILICKFYTQNVFMN